MRDPKRIDRILEQLGCAWKASPDLRLVQLLHGYTQAFRNGRDGFNYEDDDLERDLLKRLTEIANEAT